MIVRGKTPVARLTAIPQRPAKRQFGAYRGEFEVPDGFFEPLPEDELAAFEGEGYDADPLGHSHAAVVDDRQSPPVAKAREAVGAPSAEVFVSAASAWELAVKVRLGKLPEASVLTHRLAESVAEQDFKVLPISLEHGRLLPGAHRDPFDRALAASRCSTT